MGNPENQQLVRDIQAGPQSVFVPDDLAARISVDGGKLSMRGPHPSS
jgi:hypothetical protein